MKKLIEKTTLLLSLLLPLACSNITEPVKEQTKAKVSSILLKSNDGNLTYYYTTQDTVITDCINYQVDSINDFKDGPQWQFSTVKKGVGTSHSYFYDGQIVKVWSVK